MLNLPLLTMGSTELNCLSKSVINNKKRSTLLRHYIRKSDEIREKLSFKDTLNGIVTEPTTGKTFSMLKRNKNKSYMFYYKKRTFLNLSVTTYEHTLYLHF